MKKCLFRGVGTALVTPFTEQGALDLTMLRKIIQFQIEHGADALILCGTTGESPVLTDEEKRRIFQTGVHLCKGKLPIIAGVGSNDTRHTIELAQMAAQCGVDGLLVVTPYYNKTTQQGAYQHYAAIAAATELPIILYNVPSRTGMDLSAETVLKLSNIPSITAIKEAGGSMEKITRLCAESPKDFAVYTGNDGEILPVLSIGGAGVISVTSNLLPNVVHYICSAYWEGNMPAAQKTHQMLAPLNRLLFETVNPLPVKVLMEAIGFPCGPCRLPLEQLTDLQRRALLHRALPLLQQPFVVDRENGTE